MPPTATIRTVKLIGSKSRNSNYIIPPLNTRWSLLCLPYLFTSGFAIVDTFIIASVCQFSCHINCMRARWPVCEKTRATSGLYVITRTVNLMRLHVFFTTSYSKMDLAKIRFKLFIMQIQNLFCLLVHIFKESVHTNARFMISSCQYFFSWYLYFSGQFDPSRYLCFCGFNKTSIFSAPLI